MSEALWVYSDQAARHEEAQETRRNSAVGWAGESVPFFALSKWTHGVANPLGEASHFDRLEIRMVIQLLFSPFPSETIPRRSTQSTSFQDPGPFLSRPMAFLESKSCAALMASRAWIFSCSSCRILAKTRGTGFPRTKSTPANASFLASVCEIANQHGTKLMRIVLGNTLVRFPEDKEAQVISPTACGALFSARTTPQPSQNLVEPWWNPSGTAVEPWWNPYLRAAPNHPGAYLG